MKNLFVTFLLILWVLILLSCTKEAKNTVEPEDSILAFSYAKFNGSILKVEIIHNYPIFLDNYKLLLKGSVITNSDTLPIKFYDDGGQNSDSEDLIPNNNIFTAKIPDGIGNRVLDMKGYILKDNKIKVDSILFYKSYKLSVLKSISGISDNDNLTSGFKPKVLTLDFEENAPLMLDSLICDIYKNSNKVKSVPLKFDKAQKSAKMYCDLASSLSTDKYKLAFYTKLKGGLSSKSLNFNSISIENKPPTVINKTSDSLNINTASAWIVCCEVTDQQTAADISNVVMKVGDKEFNLVKTEGLYQIKFDVFNNAGVYNYKLFSLDKAGNCSDTLVCQVTAY